MQLAVVLSAASLILCVFFFFYFRSFIKRRTSPEEQLAEYRGEVHRLIADIDAATERDSLLVEERIKRVKNILDDTDKRIAVYIHELDRSRTGEALYTSLGRGIRSALGIQPQEQPEAHIPETTIIELPVSPPMPQPPPEPPPVPIKAKGRSRIKKDPVPAEPEAQPPLRVQIAELSARGFSSEKIASRLHISIAEVDLAMSLQGRNVP